MKWGIAGLVAIVLACTSPAWLPYNMDEFAHYHALGCEAFPLSRTGNVFRESCLAEDLRLPGTSAFLPLRSYAYIGSLPVVPFYPFWLAFSNPVAVRVQGMVFFLVAVLLTARLAGASFEGALLGGLLLPIYPFLFLDDLGPNGLTILLNLGSLLALRLAIRTDRGYWLVGSLAFLGFLTKPVFALYLPALVLFGIGEFRSQGRRPRLGKILSALLAFAVPAALLLLSHDREGHRYISMIQRGGISVAASSMREVFEAMGGYLLVASRVVPRTLTLKPHLVDAVPLLMGLTLLAGLRKGRVFLAMAALTFVLTLGIGAASEPHHLAFALCPLVCALAARLGECGPRVHGAALATSLVIMASLVVRWPSAPVNADTGRDKDRLLAALRQNGLESRTVQVHASWGTYYIAHLFGEKTQAVVYLNAFEASEEDLLRVRSFAKGLGRGVLLVSEGTPNARLAGVWGPPSRPETFGAWSYTLFSP